MHWEQRSKIWSRKLCFFPPENYDLTPTNTLYHFQLADLDWNAKREKLGEYIRHSERPVNYPWTLLCARIASADRTQGLNQIWFKGYCCYFKGEPRATPHNCSICASCTMHHAQCIMHMHIHHAQCTCTCIMHNACTVSCLYCMSCHTSIMWQEGVALCIFASFPKKLSLEIIILDIALL